MDLLSTSLTNLTTILFLKIHSCEKKYVFWDINYVRFQFFVRCLKVLGRLKNHNMAKLTEGPGVYRIPPSIGSMSEKPPAEYQHTFLLTLPLLLTK